MHRLRATFNRIRFRLFPSQRPAYRWISIPDALLRDPQFDVAAFVMSKARCVGDEFTVTGNTD
jgi:hypothetical protein